MREIILLNREEAIKLAEEIMYTPNFRSLRVAIQNDQASFKVNQHTWSPPVGQLDPLCQEALSREAMKKTFQNDVREDG